SLFPIAHRFSFSYSLHYNAFRFLDRASGLFCGEVSRDHMRIGLTYNEKPESASAAEPPSTNDAFAEWDDPSTIAAVEQALGPCGSVIRLEADQVFPQALPLARHALVFHT